MSTWLVLGSGPVQVPRSARQRTQATLERQPAPRPGSGRAWPRAVPAAAAKPDAAPRCRLPPCRQPSRSGWRPGPTTAQALPSIRPADRPRRHRIAPGGQNGSPRKNQRRTAAGAQRATRKRIGLGRKFAATLAPASLQNRATRTGAHPQTEAVGLGPATVVRLVGPLAHGLAPSIRRRPRWLTSALGWVDNATPLRGVTLVERTGSTVGETDGPRGLNGTDRPLSRSNREGRRTAALWVGRLRC